MKSYASSFGKIDLTTERLQHILEFHPEVKKEQKFFQAALKSPDVIRSSKSDLHVRIFYKKIRTNKFLAVVVKVNTRNFILTAYLTNKLNQNI